MEVLPDNNSVESGKTNAIISHLWLIGLIIAWILNNSKKNSFTSFYIRQMVGITAVSLLNGFLVERFSSTAAWVIHVVLFVLWIISLIGAVQGEKKQVPLLGSQFQEWFKNIG